MGLNQINFVDPTYVNEQQAAYDAYKKPASAVPKKRQQNFVQNNDDMEEEVKQLPPHLMQAAHIDIDENDQNLDMLVGGMAG